MRVAVLTISDTVAKGEREDLSGPAVLAFCRGLGWEVMAGLHVADDPADIRQQLRELADSGRVVIRYSGTEALARVMIEAESEPLMRHHADTIANAIRTELGV